ncbi:MAG TPA: hypothetical protein VN207_04665 [Ktedonobacteraceae bacterium]|nr:hypothetical protein [Ktedonobacteraceae bacterium]
MKSQEYNRGAIHSDHSTIGVITVSVDSELVEQDDLSVNHDAFIANVNSNGPVAQTGLC